IIGVAPEAEILPVSLWVGSEHPGARDIDEQIPDAVRWAVDHGADVINMSLGSNATGWPPAWDSAFAYAEEKGVLVVAAAGNRGSGLNQVGAPATIPGVLSVGGVDRSRTASWDSSSQGISIAVAGPSEEMVGAIPGDGYARWSGTSATVPLVAGTAALIKQKHPDLTAAGIAQRIVDTAHDAGAQGKDPLYGYGILDV
ncbi:S8 family serine peptidase, partial [Streptomyces sp. tea 10]|nr:S8 family serine peptidase [Streptomyces sp. tea 10]